MEATGTPPPPETSVAVNETTRLKQGDTLFHCLLGGGGANGHVFKILKHGDVRTRSESEPCLTDTYGDYATNH